MSRIGLLLLTVGVAAAQDRSTDYIEQYQKRALEIYRTSITYRTAASHGQVPALASYLADQFRAGGFADEDIHLLPFATSESEETAALVVRYRGDGSSGEKPILLVAHMDVVDALPEDWERDPFTLVEEDGYFFGRGTLDDKFGTTMLTSTFLRLKSEGFKPTRDLIIAFTGDEETEQATTRSLVTTFRDLTDSEFALNADAGGGVLDDSANAVSYLIQAAEKTYATFELTIRNPGGHSSLPRAENAIYELAQALLKIQAFRFPVRWNEITRRYFEVAGKARIGELGEAMRRFAANPDDQEAANILHGCPAQVGITRTTCVPTMLRGGHAENALPQSATATVNCRIFPGVEVSEVQAILQRVVENDQLQIEVLGDPVPGLASPLRQDVLAAVTAAVHAGHPGIPIVPYMSSYATDGLALRAAGIPTYGTMGLFIREDDEFAHGLNERVPVRSFYGALEFWHLLLTELATQ
ncbi:MAG: M20/M25/M40 family metallo-hydrolase [Fidelibacterota bacterium]|nr:MAG: M20/M25/M40 family metallo-hydrolase [Candidatus Neomarinimicrobiota bacterium]